MKKMVFLIAGLITLTASCQETAYYSTKEGALKGYDPVAYFEVGEPVKGKTDYRYQWEGVEWLFSSPENLNAFKKSPETYAPQYGGYCAYGVAGGGLYKIEPEAWKIVNGKLYLNYNLKYQKEWESDIPGYIEKADKNWPDLAKGE